MPEFTKTGRYRIREDIDDREFLAAMRAAVGALDVQFGPEVLDRIDEPVRTLFAEVIIQKEEANGKASTETQQGSTDSGQPGAGS